MLKNNIPLDLILIVLGSTIGAVKLGIETSKEKPMCQTVIDIIVGIFSGSLLAYHFGSEFNIYVSGLIALVGGACGALAITSIIEIFPNLLRNYLNKYLRDKDV